MKPLKQLGISFMPWSVNQGASIWVEDDVGNCICDELEWRGEKAMSNARLIKSAPILYAMLYKVVEACRAVGYKEFDSESDEAEHRLYALLDESESVLNEAAEEPIKL